MNVLMFSADLLFPSLVSAAGRARGHSVKIAPTPDQFKLAADSETAWDLVLLDLNAADEPIATVVRRLRQQCSSVRIVAFAPHVQVAKLNAARQAGCDLVLTQGQFNRQVEKLLA